MNWKKVVSVLLIGTMAFSMMACGGKDDSSNSASNNSSTQGGAEETKLDDKLVVWTLANDLVDFGKKFQEETGVEVDTVVIEPADYPTKVQTALLAGESEPDIRSLTTYGRLDRMQTVSREQSLTRSLLQVSTIVEISLRKYSELMIRTK